MELPKAQLTQRIRDYRRNALGLRDRDYPVVKPPGARRVLLLGDSFTFGLGVADDAAIMPELLERDLGTDQSRPVEILNGAVPGSLTTGWLAMLSKTYSVFRPDVVVAVFFLRDGTRTTAMGSFFGPIRRNILDKNRHSLLYRYSYLYRLYRDARDRRLVGGVYTEVIRASYLGSSATTAEWEIAKHNLLAMRNFAAQRGARFGLVIYPVLAGLRHDERYPFTEVHETIASFARLNSIPVHDLLDDFRGADVTTLWVSALNQHPNAKAHRMAADALRPFVLYLLDHPER